ncbi:hypothetical protein HOJ01_04545 [bacterium]|jgi:bifunctional oligoribonuclease and PAP phosphatase NrnA|nr:hypothetical protein [bacterium]MBT6294046.1 hypothetical protein [bacterium]
MLRYLFENTKSIGIIGHQNPDIDCLSSIFAIADISSQLNTDFQIYLKKPLPEKYSFLNYAKHRIDLEIKSNHCKFISVDCANYKRLMHHPDPLKLINIDHHKSNTNYGSLNIVDISSNSTSQLIFKLLQNQNLHISKDLANNILAGIYADTLSLQTKNVNSEVLRTCSKLLRLGASLEKVVKNLNKISFQNLKILGKVLLNSKIHKNYAKSRIHGDLNKDHLRISSYYLNQIPNTKMSVLMTENKKGEVRTSLRSDTISVHELAKKFNGGGHQTASGFEYKKLN